MIKITKSREPNKWTERKNTPGYSYEADPALRKSLLEEQGYICAYCMNRIDTSNSKIEHIKCRSRYPELELVYNNMVICCKGNTENKLHCDSSKSDKDISFDLFSDFFADTISYKSKEGDILSSNGNYDKDINEEEGFDHEKIADSFTYSVTHSLYFFNLVRRCQQQVFPGRQADFRSGDWLVYDHRQYCHQCRQRNHHG